MKFVVHDEGFLNELRYVLSSVLSVFHFDQIVPKTGSWINKTFPEQMCKMTGFSAMTKTLFIWKKVNNDEKDEKVIMYLDRLNYGRGKNVNSFI